MNVVKIVHCIDTEGPLAEKTLYHYFQNLGKEKLEFAFQKDLYENELEALIDQHRSGVLGTWEELFFMLKDATSSEFRCKDLDSQNNGWVYNWFCLDHINFMYNPRQRAMGIHQVFDFYKDLVKNQNFGDGLHWHFHPMSTYMEANKCATSYTNSSHLYEILCRRVIERKWFPRANRAGFQDERPDSHWFLEQWIPFDFSNTNSKDWNAKKNPDLINGRLSDWRWAPDDWRTYHPDHNSYHLEGNCKRKIARSLNVLNRFANINEVEVRKAFQRAANGEDTLLSISTHDWRDLRREVDCVRYLINLVKKDFPDVEYHFSEAIDAFNFVHPSINKDKIKLGCKLIFDDQKLPKKILINIEEGSIFGSQPFLAIKTRGQNFIHDNLNYDHSLDSWNYIFDTESILPSDVEAVGVACNDDSGNQSIHVYDLKIKKIGLREIIF